MDGLPLSMLDFRRVRVDDAFASSAKRQQTVDWVQPLRDQYPYQQQFRSAPRCIFK